MKVVIVGAGAVGSVLARQLAGRDGFSVACATNDLAAARRFVAGAGRRIRLVRADAAGPSSIARAAKGADVIVNASLPEFNLHVMRAALLARAHYLDLDSHLRDWRHVEQLRFGRRFERSGLTALINAGVSPGLSNVLAAEAAERFERLDGLHFRILEEQVADRLIPTWSKKVIKDTLSAWPLIYRRGRFGFTRPFKDPERFAFPRPYGRRRVVSIYGDEVATVPLFLVVKNADYKVGGGDVESATAGEGGGEVPTPMEMRRLVREGVVRDARLIVSVEARGKRRRGSGPIVAHAVFPDIRSIMRRAPGATYIGYPTAICAAAFVSILPLVRKSGVLPPEALGKEARRSIIAELKRKGVTFKYRGS
jgi:hypothetical protein